MQDTNSAAKRDVSLPWALKLLKRNLGEARTVLTPRPDPRGIPCAIRALVDWLNYSSTTRRSWSVIVDISLLVPIKNRQ